MQFDILYSNKETAARSAILKTDHSKIHTPVFMPIGTQGAVKTIDPEVLTNLNANIILGNTYHLYICLLYTSPSPRDRTRSRMPSSA